MPSSVLTSRLSEFAHALHIGILADNGYSVQQSRTCVLRDAVKMNAQQRYCRAGGGGFVGQGAAACAGAAGAGAGAGTAAAAGFFAAGFFAAGFFAGGFFAPGGAPGVSSTTTGFGRSLGGSPVAVIASSFSVSGR